MSKNTRLHKKKEIDELVKELRNNDTTYKKSKDQLDVVVHGFLVKENYITPDSPFYVSMLDKMKSELAEIELVLPTGFKVINPIYEYQTNPAWQKLQCDILSKKKKAIQDNIKHVNEGVDKVKAEILEQRARWEDRRKQLIIRLKQLGYDVSEFEVPAYII